MIDFIEKNGVDRKKFLEQYNSFAVDGMVRKAKKKIKAYQIEGVPSVVVNGKYLTSGSMAGSYDNMIKITNYLIAKESQQLITPLLTGRDQSVVCRSWLRYDGFNNFAVKEIIATNYNCNG